MFKNILIIRILSFTLHNYYENIEKILLLDKIFDPYIDYPLSFDNCILKKVKNFHYRGRAENINKIINSNKYNSYKIVFLDENFNVKDNIKLIQKFPQTTIFLTKSKETVEDYCFIKIDKDLATYSQYYLQIGPQLDVLFLDYIHYFIYIFDAIIFCLILIYIIYSKRSKIKLYMSRKVYYILVSSLLPFLSCYLIHYIILVSLIYTVYKSILIVYIIYLLNGYKILHFADRRKDIRKYSIILALIELVFSIIFLYIIYFIPSFDNFYLFFSKSLIEHLVIFVILVKKFFINFICLFRQYKFERRIRTILTIAYKYKLLIYSKIFIFSLLYSLCFIALNIIIIAYHLNYKIYGLEYIYYMYINLELLFAIIYAVIFFPIKNSLIYNMRIYNYNYNSINFIGIIKNDKEQDMKFNRIKRKNLKEKYLKKQYPLILIEPFAQTNNIFNNEHSFIHIGIAKKK